MHTVLLNQAILNICKIVVAVFVVIDIGKISGVSRAVV